MALETNNRPRTPQAPGGQPRRFRDSFNEYMDRRTGGGWMSEDPTVRRKTRRTVGVAAVLSLAFGGAAAVAGLDAALGGIENTGITPTDNPQPAYTGPSDRCWTLYDHALQDQSVPVADAKDLVACGDQNPGYFQQDQIPVLDPQGNVVDNITYGDRPAK